MLLRRNLFSVFVFLIIQENIWKEFISINGFIGLFMLIKLINKIFRAHGKL